MRNSSRRQVATYLYAPRSGFGGAKAGRMAGETNRRDLRKNESESIDSDQPSVNQVPHHAQHGQPVHARRQLSFRLVLRAGRLLVYAARRSSWFIRQHSGRVGWRGRPLDVSGQCHRLLAGNNLRLPLLRVYFRWNDHRFGENLAHWQLSAVGRPASLWRVGEFLRHWIPAAASCLRPSRATFDDLADEGGEPEIFPYLVSRQAAGIRHPPLLYALCSRV